MQTDPFRFWTWVTYYGLLNDIFDLVFSFFLSWYLDSNWYVLLAWKIESFFSSANKRFKNNIKFLFRAPLWHNNDNIFWWEYFTSRESTGRSRSYMNIIRMESSKQYQSALDWYGLVWLVGFYGISTFVGYLTPNPFLCK